MSKLDYAAANWKSKSHYTRNLAHLQCCHHQERIELKQSGTVNFITDFFGKKGVPELHMLVHASLSWANHPCSGECNYGQARQVGQQDREP
jgi:hypothetical protein